MSTKEEVIRLIKNMPNNVTTEEIIRELYAKVKMDNDLAENQPEGNDSFNENNGKVGKWLH